VFGWARDGGGPRVDVSLTVPKPLSYDRKRGNTVIAVTTAVHRAI
jgi:hypothetical protein